MKKLQIIIILLVILFLSSCDGRAYNAVLCYKSVRDIFPNSSIYRGESKYIFVVITEQDSIYLVETMSTSGPQVTSIEPLNKIQYGIK